MADGEGRVVVPGERLGHAGAVKGGAGTYTLDDFVRASVVGRARTRDGTVEVVRERAAAALPECGDTVLAKVLKLNSRYASVEIVSVGAALLKEAFPAIVRARDVRAFDIDSVQIYRSFRPGDIVRAEVISLGDSRSYFLSTARNDLGVILATSAAGHTMVPVSWQQMQCPVTKAKEYRKVAKIDAGGGADEVADAKMDAE